MSQALLDLAQQLFPAQVPTAHAVAFGLAFLLAAVLGVAVKPLAIKANLVSRPRADRWARTVIPLGGGIAITLALVAGLVVIALRTPPDPATTGSFLGDRRFDLAIACFAVFLLGLVDDKLTLSPPAKLVVQTAAACFLVLRGTTLPIGPELVRAPITVGWFVFLTNSVNLLDNMDGSAAGVSAVASGFVYAIAAGGGREPDVAASAAVLTGATLGFLVHNFPPASMFMGDAGSLVLGFALAGLSARLPRTEAEPHLGSLAAPALILALPIFDTALVWVARRSARRPFFLGGRDHTTHRLVALGLTERQTVLVLYAAACVLGLAALAVARGGIGTAVLVALGVAIALLLCGVFLSDVRVYKAGAPAPGAAPSPGTGESAREALNPALYAVEIAVDVAVFCGAWVAAYVVKFADSGSLDDYLRGSCLRALPFVIGLKVLSLLSQGLYRGVWRSIQFEDLFKILKASALGTLLVVAAAAVADRLVDYSREVFALDALFATAGIFLSRSALRALRRSVALIAPEPRKAVLVGARSLLPLVSAAVGAEGKPAYRLVGVLDPETPAGLPEAAPPSLAGTLAGAAATIETAGATVALVALVETAEGGRASLVKALGARGVEVVTVTAKLE